MRAIILKARKLGVSTMAQGLLIQRTTLQPLHAANVIAHNTQTAGAIMQIAELMYAHLPEIEDEEILLKPPIANRRRLKELRFGEPDQFAGATANKTFGANQSSYTVDTAKEFEGARGLTLQSVHGSEVAFWTDLKRKLTTVSSAIDFTDPNTLAIYESTANGHNEFKALCDQAMQGEGDFPLLFLSWFDDPRYTRALSRREAERFEIGRARVRRGGARTGRALRADPRAIELAALGDRDALPGRRDGLPSGVPELPRGGVPRPPVRRCSAAC